jgi:HAMP domain-containing protein
MEKLQDTVNKKVQDVLKKYQDTTNKKIWEDTEATKWIQRGLQQNQNETKETVKTEIYEIKKTTQDMKQELNRDVENLRKWIK